MSLLLQPCKAPALETLQQAWCRVDDGSAKPRAQE